MIKKLKKTIGVLTGDRSSVIGEVDKTGTGKTLLRVGGATGNRAWEQTEHVVLTPEERDELIDVLSSHQEYPTIKIGDVVGQYFILAVHYVNGSGEKRQRIGAVLAWNGGKGAYAVLSVNPQGELEHGTHTPDGQRALNAYITRVNEHLFRHFNAKPPTLTFAAVADRDKLTEGK